MMILRWNKSFIETKGDFETGVESLSKALYSFLMSITKWGVTPLTTPQFAKRIILTNLLGLLFTCNMSVSAIAFLYFGQYKLAAFTFFFVITEFCWPLLNRFGYYNLSRLGLLVSSNILGFMVSILLPGTGYNRGFFVMAGLPIMLFFLKEKKSILLGLILPIVLYPLSDIISYPLGLSPSVNEFIYYTIGVIYVGLIFLMFLFLARENDNAIELLEEQRARTFSSAKFAALGEMASGIGHEINNPTTIIELNTRQIEYLIKNDEPKAEALERLAVISKTVRRITRIVESMKNFSRESSRDEFQNEEVKKIVTETLVFCGERFKHHHIQFSTSYSEENISINCKPSQISQILLNLLNNAFDAIEVLPEKWIKLDVIRVNGKVLISITDSGKGIPVEEQERIFRPFYTTKPVGRGTGLGLSLSRKIAEDHGGTLTLDTSSKNTKFDLEV